MTDAVLGYGTKYEISTTTGGGTFFELGEVIDVSLPSSESARVEATHYQSPNRSREYIAGLQDFTGEASVQINWIPGNATDEFLQALRLSGETRTHRVTFPNGATMSFPGFISGYSGAIPIDDRMTATFNIAQGGAETWAA